GRAQPVEPDMPDQRAKPSEPLAVFYKRLRLVLARLPQVVEPLREEGTNRAFTLHTPLLDQTALAMHPCLRRALAGEVAGALDAAAIDDNRNPGLPADEAAGAGNAADMGHSQASFFSR